MNLLTTYTYQSVLQALNNAIADLHSLQSLEHTLSLRSLLSVDVSRKRILTMEILQLLWSHRCPLVNAQHLNST
jgi:hypothetical protein